MPKKSDDSLDTLWIKAFLAVRSHGSFDAAAKALGCGQSTITNRVSKLEGWLGATLLNREGRPTLPTSFGLAFSETAIDVLQLLDDFRAVSAGHPAPGASAAPETPRKGWWTRTFGVMTGGLAKKTVPISPLEKTKIREFLRLLEQGR